MLKFPWRVLVCVWLWGVGVAWGEFRVVEFLAENGSGLADEDGERSDWIEVANVAGSAADLGGWSLTDDAGDLNHWVFPSLVLGAGESVVVFASGKDRRDAAGELHTNFSLDQDGEYLALVRPDGGGVASEYAPFPRQREDVSYGVGRKVDADVLVAPDSATRFHVPSSGALGTSWREREFDDGGWTAATAAVGYQVGLAGGSAGEPQAYWAFDGDANDGSGNGHDGTLSGGGFSGEAAAGSGSLDLDGSASYVSVDLDVAEDAFTSSLWFRTRDGDGGLFVVVDGDLGAGGHDRHVYLRGGNVFVRTWNNETIGTAALNLADGEWHHVAHVFGGDEGGQRIYVDGRLEASGNKSNSDFNWQRRVNIGFSNDATQNYFDGQIDEVAVWEEALNAGQVRSLAAGASPMALSGVDPLVDTDVEAAMRGRNPSAYVRAPFDAPGEDDYDRLELEVWYQDGFVAYLNGLEVVRRNAPGGDPGWDAAALDDRTVSHAVVGERIDLSAFIGPLLHEGNVFAVQLLNEDASDASALLRFELEAQEVEEEVERYFVSPSPGEPNPAGVEDFVADTKFSHDRGYYDEAFEVRVTSATPGARIAWTTDGSAPVPGAAGTTVAEAADAETGPAAVVPVTTTTTLRAAAYKDGFQPTNIDTHTYLFAADVARQPARPAGFPASWTGATADYGMDPDVVNTTLPGYGIEEALLSLPAMSVVSAPGDLFGASSGVYSNSGGRGFAWEREVSVEFWYPDGRRDGFQVGAGVRAHGNSSRSHGFTLKHPLRLYFRERYGATKLRFRMFEDSEVDRFDHLLLRGCSTDSFPVTDGPPRWINDKGTYLRDQYMRDTLRDLGNVSCHGTYVNLYLNGLYWGIYNVAERPIDDFNASYHGGEKEDYDVIKDFAELQEGNRSSWDAMMAAVAGGLTSEAAYQRFLGNDPDGTRNPALPVHLHEKSFIDYMIAHIAGGAEDWPNHNYWAGRRRGEESEGWYFYAWDQEISNDDLRRDRSVIFPQQPFESVNAGGSPAIVYDRLRRNATFAQKFRDRVHELFFNGGPMSPEANRARWAARQAEIDRAIVGESARWGDMRQHPPIKRETLWMREMNWMQREGGFWDQNHVRAVQRFRNVGLYPDVEAPVFTRNGGVLPAGGAVSFEDAAAGGTIWYTTDGSDPRGDDGSVSGTARAFDGSAQTEQTVGRGSEWRYWDQGGIADDGWKARGFDDAGWASGAAPLGYGDGDEETVVGFGESFINRHITTYFRRTFDVADAGAVVELALEVLRDDGAVVYLNGVEVARTNLPDGEITSETRALSNVVGADESDGFYAFDVDPALLVDGANVLAVEVHQVSPTSGDLSFDLGLEARVVGGAGGARLPGSGVVRARVLDGGEWSGMNSAFFFVGTAPASAANLVVSEVQYHPADASDDEVAAGFGGAGAFEYIELLNVSDAVVDLAGVAFVDGVSFVFPADVPAEVSPGGRVLVVADAAAMAVRYGDGLPVVGEFADGTRLGNGGERIELRARDGEVVAGFEYDDVAPWPEAADGGGGSLVLADEVAGAAYGEAGSWRTSGVDGGTPGEAEPDGRVVEALVALAGAEGLLVNDGGDDFAAVRYREVRGAGAEGVAYVVEVSDDLVGWRSGVGETVLVEEVDAGDGTAWVTVRAAGSGVRYLRVRVEQ